MNRETNSGAGVLIFLASLVLVAINAKAETKEPKIENTRLVWASDCPKGMPSTNNSNLCKKRVYVDDSVDLKDLKWQEVEDIANIAYADWKQKLKTKFNKKQ